MFDNSRLLIILCDHNGPDRAGMFNFPGESDAQGPGTRPREEKEEAAEATRGAAAAVAPACEVETLTSLRRAASAGIRSPCGRAAGGRRSTRPGCRRAG